MSHHRCNVADGYGDGLTLTGIKHVLSIQISKCIMCNSKQYIFEFLLYHKTGWTGVVMILVYRAFQMPES